jgi:hypothetical protein
MAASVEASGERLGRLGDLAVMIRCHGEMPLHQVSKDSFDVTRIPFKPFANIPNLSIVSLSPLGGTCTGDSNIELLIRAVNKDYKSTVKNTQEKITEVFTHRGMTASVRKIMVDILGKSQYPELLHLREHVVEKRYTRESDNSGIFLFSSDADQGTLAEVKRVLAGLTEQLREHGTYRSNILHELGKFGFDRIYLIDFTCDVYTPQVSPANLDFITAELTKNACRGGRRTRKSR